MWYLVENEPQDGPRLRYWLGGVNPSGRLIGRKNVNILIKQSSVSRAHATVRIVEASRYSLSERGGPTIHSRSTGVEVEDSSAYGTYLKYPSSNPDVDEKGRGHHTRLTKNSVTEISEGAHLAFGAPSSWWRLGWHNILCFVPDYQSSAVKKLVRSATWNAGLEITKLDSSEVTHVVVESARTDCMSILGALARGAHVVTPAWLSSVQHTVEEGCKRITDALNNEAALAASKLADESNFAPKFSSEDKRLFGADVLEDVFSNTTKARRSSVFKNRGFAFVEEDTLDKWASILGHMGARTLMAGTLQKGNRAGVIIVEEDAVAPKRKRARKSTASENKGKVTERSLIASLLSGDESHVIQKEEEEEDVVDEATDVEEESKSKQSTVTESRRRTTEDSQSTEKTVVGTKLLSGERVDESADMIDLEDLNERVPMKMAPLETAKNSTPRTSVHDVRRFRRRNLPSVSKVPLKKARYVDEDEEFVQASRKHERSRGRGRAPNPAEDEEE